MDRAQKIAMALLKISVGKWSVNSYNFKMFVEVAEAQVSKGPK
jgi:hypothetical protein